MKSINSVIMTGFLFFFGVLAIHTLVNDIALSNSSGDISLDNESIELIQNYNTQYQNLNSSQIYSTYNESGLPNYEGIGDQAKEAAEAKGVIETFNDLWDVITHFPAVMLASMPFLDLESSQFLTEIILVFMGILTIYGVIALVSAWRTGGTN